MSTITYFAFKLIFVNKLLSNSDGLAVFSGTSFGLFGQLFDKGKFTEIHDLYTEIKKIYGDRFYIEIQRHKEQNEIGFEKFNLNKSLELEIPIIATSKPENKATRYG